jgi:hypothetical protein
VESVPFVLAALVALLAYVALVVSDRRAIFWLGFAAVLVPVEYVDRYFVDLPSAVKWLPELALTGAGAAAFVLCPRERAGLPRGVLWVVAAQLALALVSKLVNGSSWPAFVVAQRGLVLFCAAALAQKSVDGIFERERRDSFLVGAGVLSALVCVLQRVTIGRSEPDKVTGLFSLGEVMLFFHLVVLALVLASWLERRRIGRWNLALVAGGLVLSLGVANQEAAFPYLVLLVGWFLVRARARRGPLLLATLAGGAVLLLLFSVLYDSAYRADEGKRSFSESLVDLAYLKRYVFGERHDVYTPGGDLLRGAAIVTAYREVAGAPATLLVGRGPGATSESGVSGASGPLALAFPGIGRVSLSLLLGDVGLLGVLLHCMLLVAVWCGARRAPVQEEDEQLFRGAAILIAISFAVYFRLVYEPVFAWLLASLCRSRAQNSARPSRLLDSVPVSP